jgi:hypothetical protein
MSDRERRAAVEAFVRSYQRAVSSVSAAVLVQESRTIGDRRAFRLSEGWTALRGPHRLELSILHEFEIDSAGQASRGSVSTVGYWYEIRRRDGPTVFAYHWHPVGLSHVTTPHLHVGGTSGGLNLTRAHLPTGYITLQHVIRFAIVDLGVEPLRDDWREVLVGG